MDEIKWPAKINGINEINYPYQKYTVSQRKHTSAVSALLHTIQQY